MDLSAIPYYTFVVGEMAGVKEVIVSNTGYTGAGGFELYFYPEHADAIWNAVLKRDRSLESSPWDWVPAIHFVWRWVSVCTAMTLMIRLLLLKQGLGWITKFVEGKNFINRAMLEKQKQEGLAVS